ncbi:interferon alpha-inducible protein 27-like protein 2 [Ornithodoros turicata]|uniref:interferon alpha-inducible protein 27-like protein 2 n=1 Tax=Ornithodoros turicata TaxID=34597 RepID=UPI003138F93A
MKHVAAAAAVGAGLAVLAAPLALGALGFSAAGVGAGTLAATWHSAIGVVAKGSVFSLLQSFGAAGIPATVQVAVGAVGGTAGAAVGAAMKAAGFGSGKKETDESEESEEECEEECEEKCKKAV